MLFFKQIIQQMKRNTLLNLPYIAVICFISLMGSQSCKNSVPNPVDRKYTKQYNKLFDFVRKEQINLPLDSLTSPNIICTQYYVDPGSGKSYICFLNSLVNTIYGYDYNTKSLAFKLKLDNDGPNGVGGRMESFYIHSFDSIFVSSRYMVSLVDTGRRKIRSFNLAKKQSNDITALPSFSGYQQPAILNDNFYFPCAPDIDPFTKSSFTDKECLVKLNLNTGEYEYKFKPSDLFQKGVYGPNYTSSYDCFNTRKNMVLISFQNDPLLFLHSIDADDSGRTVYAGSESFDEVSPMQKITRDFEGYTRFYIKSPSYGPIIYDPYRNMYYRFALTPLSDEDYAQRKWWKKKSLIILDSTFVKVGETKISDSCSFLNYFITEDGLFISQAGASEDSLLYTKYLPQKI
jgi:hypothetical protein